jgi:hypothetical protein
MPKWTDYTIKTTVADNDEIMTLDTAGKANKRLSLSTLSDWVLGKIADKVFEKLQTNDKTILGAINELNSKAELKVITTTSGEYTLVPDQTTPYEAPVPSEDGYEIISKLYSYSNGAVIYVSPNGWASNFTNTNRTCTFSTVWLLRKK